MNPQSAIFLRAVRGPVMLITVGTLFALQNFTPFSFDRTWPVLVIVAGILNLGGKSAPVRTKIRYQAQWGPPRPPVPPPTPAPPRPPSSSGEATTSPAGTYRGSAYEATPGGSAARNSENRNPENKETRERPSDPNNPGVYGSGSGATQ